MSARTQTMRLSDGRVLDVAIGGAESGPALVCLHGTPSDGTIWNDWDGVARTYGLRLIAHSRPGYATSTRQPGRTVASGPFDVGEILDRFAAPWFVAAGWSGGGPHALACAALDKRCRAVASLAGVGPYDARDLNFLDGMGPENHAEFGAALEGEGPLRVWLAENAESMRTATGAELADAFGGLVPQVDKDVLTGGFAESMAGTMRRALASGFDGWVDDDMAFTADWNFDLGRIAIPVTVWQGDLDLMVPAAHGRWLADHIGGARLRSAPGHGHVSLIAAYRDEIVADLIRGAEEAY